METNNKLAYSVDEVADRLGISHKTVRRMLKDGRLPSVRCGDRWLVPISSLNRWLETASAKSV